MLAPAVPRGRGRRTTAGGASASAPAWASGSARAWESGVGTGVGEGVGDGVGPVLITRSTWEPAATSTPSAGLLRMTDPSGTDGVWLAVDRPDREVEARQGVAGLLLGLAAQSGNRHVAGPGRDEREERRALLDTLAARGVAANDPSLLDVVGRLLLLGERQLHVPRLAIEESSMPRLAVRARTTPTVGLGDGDGLPSS